MPSGRPAGARSSGSWSRTEPDTAAASLAAFLPNVLAVRAPEASGRPAAAVVAARVAALAAASDPRPAYFLLGATPDGRDVAGMLSARLGIGVLANATSVAWGDATGDVPEGPRVEVQPWGGRLQTRSAFTADTGIILLRPNMVTAAPLATPGRVGEGLPARRRGRAASSASSTASPSRRRVPASRRRG